MIFHLHGHQFNDKSYHFKIREEGIYRYDVGVDVHKYRPVNFDEMSGFFICKFVFNQNISFVFMNMKKLSSNK